MSRSGLEAGRVEAHLLEINCIAQAAPQVSDAPAAQLSTIGQSLDIERALMSHLPRADASPAEFAMGLLRAQVKAAQTAIAIELVNKTTQQLSQGVQSLATRS